MNKSLLWAIIFSAFIPFSTSFAAGIETPRVDKRQENQERRIQQGVDSGRLNEHEANRMNRTQNRIERSEEAAKSDGVVTRKERARLHHQQKRANKRIYRNKHNAR